MSSCLPMREGGFERIAQVIRTAEIEPLLFLGGWRSWIPAYALVGGLLIVIAGLYLRRPLREFGNRFPRKTLIALGGIVTLVVGGAGIEMIWFPYSDQGSALYHLEVAIEEFLEMAGASIVLYAALEIAAALCSEGKAQGARPHS